MKSPGLPARKRWGQHFLAQGSTARRIIAAARISSADTVIEVGPGDGALTRPLAARAGRLLAVEIDPLRAKALDEEFAGEERVRIVAGDLLKKSFREWLAQVGWQAPALLVGNLPFNAATAVLFSAIEDPATICRAVVTVQREVAERLTARPGQAAYGYLSLRAAAFAEARILFHLPPGAFRPRPKVTSSVLEVTPREPGLDPDLRRGTLKLASLGFQSRRKTLANALAPAGGRAQWEGALRKLGRDVRVRAEELSLEDFLALAGMAPP